MIFFHGLRLYRLAAAEADMSYTPPFGGAIFFSMVRMIELLRRTPFLCRKAKKNSHFLSKMTVFSVISNRFRCGPSGYLF